MKLKSIGLFIFIASIYGCVSTNQPLSLSQIIEYVNTGQAILLDVRAREEYEKLEPQMPCISHCKIRKVERCRISSTRSKFSPIATGMRSEKARKVLVENGYTAVEILRWDQDLATSRWSCRIWANWLISESNRHEAGQIIGVYFISSKWETQWFWAVF